MANGLVELEHPRLPRKLRRFGFNQSMTTSSTALGPLATSQVHWLKLCPAVMKSARTPGHAGDDGMNAKSTRVVQACREQ